MTWRTSDGSPWWLRSSTYSQPDGDYTANCYMDLWKTPFSETNIMFNDVKCTAHSDAYYCQPVKKKAAPPPLAPPPPPMGDDQEGVPPPPPMGGNEPLPCLCVPCGSKKGRKMSDSSCGPRSDKCGPSAGVKKDGCYSAAPPKVPPFLKMRPDQTCDCKMAVTAKPKEDGEDGEDGEAKPDEKKVNMMVAGADVDNDGDDEGMLQLSLADLASLELHKGHNSL